jgi:hypothetical protein
MAPTLVHSGQHAEPCTLFLPPVGRGRTSKTTSSFTSVVIDFFDDLTEGAREGPRERLVYEVGHLQLQPWWLVPHQLTPSLGLCLNRRLCARW